MIDQKNFLFKNDFFKIQINNITDNQIREFYYNFLNDNFIQVFKATSYIIYYCVLIYMHNISKAYDY